MQKKRKKSRPDSKSGSKSSSKFNTKNQGIINFRVKRAVLCLIIIFTLAFLNTTDYLPSIFNFFQLFKKNTGFIVCIDPGHGGYDGGTKSSDGILEKNINLSVGLKLGQLLEKNNIKVVYTRQDNTINLGSTENEDLEKRIEISKDSNAYLFVSIHCNSCNNQAIRGVELWCNDPNTQSDILAKDVRSELLKLNYTSARAMKYKDTNSLYVLRNNPAISTLVEIGYLSNATDKKFISSDSGQSQCASAIANAIIKFKKDYYKEPVDSE